MSSATRTSAANPVATKAFVESFWKMSSVPVKEVAAAIAGRLLWQTTCAPVRRTDDPARGTEGPARGAEGPFNCTDAFHC